MSLTPTSKEDSDPLPNTGPSLPTSAVGFSSTGSSQASTATPQQPDPNITQETAFELMKQRTMEKKATLQELFNMDKKTSLWDYYNRMETTRVRWERSEELLTATFNEAKRLFGEEDAHGIVKQLREAFQVSTTEHHGLFAPIDWMASTFSRALYNQKKHPERKYHIGFVCSNVSLNNISFPRGILFYGDQNKPDTSDGLLDLVFYSSKHGKDTLYGLPPLPEEEFDDLIKQVNAMASKQELSKESRRKLQEIVEASFFDPKILSAASFADQMGLANQVIWDKLWGEKAHPKLIYLEQETIASQLLIDHHLNNPQSDLYKLLFSPIWEPFVEQAFDGIDGAFCNRDFCGSYMFWAIPPGKQHRVCLVKNGDKLQTRDGKYEIPYNPESVAAALKRKELMPTLLVTFATLSFYYGLEVIGGGNQVNYLTKMKNGLLWVKEQTGDLENIQDLKAIRTNLFSCDLFFGLVSTPEGGGIPTSIDLLLYGYPDWIDRAEANMKELPLPESFEPSIPGYYTDYADDFPPLPEVSIETASRWVASRHTLQFLGNTQE